jgi:phage tail sheath protein FI
MVMDMSTRLIAGIAEADIERVRRPIPTSSTALAGIGGHFAAEAYIYMACSPYPIVILIRRSTAILYGSLR